MDEGQLRQAAEQWDAERAPFPDRTTLAAIPGSGPWRETTVSEAALLAVAVSGDWEDASELRSQLPGLLVRPGFQPPAESAGNSRNGRRCSGETAYAEEPRRRRYPISRG